MTKKEAQEHILAILQGDEHEIVTGPVSSATTALTRLDDHKLTRHFQAFASTPKHHVNIRRAYGDIAIGHLVGRDTEIWLDSKNRVAYIKGWSNPEARIYKLELKDAMTAGKVTLPSGAAFYPPFRRFSGLSFSRKA